VLELSSPVSESLAVALIFPELAVTFPELVPAGGGSSSPQALPSRPRPRVVERQKKKLRDAGMP
jgi:hypothetical protein